LGSLLQVERHSRSTAGADTVVADTMVAPGTVAAVAPGMVAAVAPGTVAAVAPGTVAVGMEIGITVAGMVDPAST